MSGGFPFLEMRYRGAITIFEAFDGKAIGGVSTLGYGGSGSRFPFFLVDVKQRLMHARLTR